MSTSSAVTILDQYFPLGIGTIDPDIRLHQHELDAAELDAFLRNLGEFYTTVETTGKAIPAQCVDGRSRVDGTYEPRPKAAAGTFSAVIGDALTNASYRPRGGTAADHAQAVYAFFQRHGYVGGHDADHASDGGCGCGAEDKLREILAYIRDHSADIRGFLQHAGIMVDDETHGLIAKQATALLGDNYVVSGVQLRDAFINVSGISSIETLTGPHNEVALVINTQAGSTIDRVKLAQTYGTKLQVFELDVPALKAAADALAISLLEAEQKFVAMLYYNVATAAVLAGPSLRVVTR